MSELVTGTGAWVYPDACPRDYYPFQDNSDPDKHHEFVRKDINFKDIIDLYCFDRRLRFLVFNALEKVEVALRAKITQSYSEATNDSYWN